MRLKDELSYVEEDSDLRDELGRSENTEERPDCQRKRIQENDVSLWGLTVVF